ncbi:hypothetical protein DRO58_01580 [Candidatus Bathyarchaeota archaeon]|nr:MAG: hypothetical protein DRO58_01580 [Candidatus Bathyarchaeota archaeon]
MSGGISRYSLSTMASAWFGFYIAYSKQLKDRYGGLPNDIRDLADIIEVERLLGFESRDHILHRDLMESSTYSISPFPASGVLL